VGSWAVMVSLGFLGATLDAPGLVASEAH